MCLNNLTTDKPIIAEKDIVCYKVLRVFFDCEDTGMVKITLNGKTFDGIISNNISYCTRAIIIHNNEELGSNIDARMSFGFKYQLNHNDKLEIDGKPVALRYLTLYQFSQVSPGEYGSKLINFNKEVNYGLHTFENLEDARFESRSIFSDVIVVRCIIPKGAEYYKGAFNCMRSYASNKLIYKDMTDVFE